MMTTPLTSVTVDGVQHELANLSEGIRNAANLYQTLQKQLAEAQVEALKCQLAVQAVAEQIRNAVLQEVSPEPDPDAVTDVDAKA